MFTESHDFFLNICKLNKKETFLLFLIFKIFYSIVVSLFLSFLLFLFSFFDRLKNLLIYLLVINLLVFINFRIKNVRIRSILKRLKKYLAFSKYF